ncbi:MAG: ATP-grasp domain-containing protein [Bdellovibrionales bacterium]|nr:ATP-grasp domain-containing protein [Bdellovibrionales bacterium]
MVFLQLFDIVSSKGVPPTMKLYNHTLQGTYPGQLDGIVGFQRYGSRALGSTVPADVIQINPELSEQFGWIANHFRTVGIETAETVIFDDRFEVANDYPEHEFDVFLFSDLAHRVRPDDRRQQAVRRIDNKNEFIKLCQSLGTPVPATQCFDCAESLAAAADELTFPLYLKVAVSASGQGVMRCRDGAELRARASGLPGVPFQLQAELRGVRFLNLQYVDRLGRAERLGATSQVLDGFVHAGNQCPAPSEPWHVTDRIAQEVVSLGVKGVFAFDVAVSEDDPEQAYVIECNPRWNGSTYFWNVASRLGVTCWESRNISTNGRTTLDGLPLGDLTFDPCRKKGVVVVNWGCIKDGKLGVLLAGDCDERAEMLEALRARL